MRGRARKARGCDLAFDLYVETDIEGELPEGGRDQARVRVSSVVAFLVMKGMALHDRLKEKDAWDIYFTLINYPGGLDALAQEIRQHVDHGLVQEGLNKIADKFASPDHMGPKFVADFALDRFHRLAKVAAISLLHCLLRRIELRIRLAKSPLPASRLHRSLSGLRPNDGLKRLIERRFHRHFVREIRLPVWIEMHVLPAALPLSLAFSLGRSPFTFGPVIASPAFLGSSENRTIADDYTARSLRGRKEKLMIFFIWAWSLVREQ